MMLRPYQQEAIDAVYRHLRERDDNPAIVLPTGAGKGYVIAQLCADAVGRWGGRVLVLAHVKELLEQAVDKLSRIAPELKSRVGVYSAGLNSRDTEHPVIIAGIQSVYKRACDLGPFDLAIVDECHLIGESESGMYRSFLAEAKVVNPALRVIGLTATPYRMKSGLICTPDGFLNHVCYEIGVKELIVQGYLCPLKTKAGVARADTSGLHVRAGEFVAAETEALMDTDELVRAACAEIVEQTRERPDRPGRSACLIFASGIEHGLHVQRVLREEHAVTCECVFGHTPASEREELLARFRGNMEGLFREPLPYLVNVNVLTTGFDAPNVDCVAMLRPTMSPGLYYQMVGRGFRMSPGKADCLVLDFGGNVLRHGPVDSVRIAEQAGNGGEAPAKECPECHSVVACGYRVCPDCGYEFPPPERQKHDPRASSAAVLSGEVTTVDYPVDEVYYAVHSKRGAPPDHPVTMRVEYRVGWGQWLSEFLCFDHSGWPRVSAERWWQDRTDWPVPASVQDAVDAARAGALCETVAIRVRRVEGERYDRVVGYQLGPKPLNGCDRDGNVLTDEIPF